MKTATNNIKLSTLRKWQDQIVKDAIDNEYLEEMTDKEKEIYTRGIICGFRECHSTLSMHKIINVKID